jgi:hypothetical protein
MAKAGGMAEEEPHRVGSGGSSNSSSILSHRRTDEKTTEG